MSRPSKKQLLTFIDRRIFPKSVEPIKTYNFPFPITFRENSKENLYYNFLLEKISKYQVGSDDAIGIEVEVEGILDITKHVVASTNWTFVEDSSLRDNGIEFVSKPLQIKEAPKAIAVLWTILEFSNKKNQYFSWRTSIHIHLNMRERTVSHIIRFILTYLIFEESLYEFSGADRKHSIFCLPIKESDLIFSLNDFLHKKLTFKPFINQWPKYTGLNLHPLLDKGTVEFRHMEGTNSPERICKWIGLIAQMQKYCDTVKLKTLIEEILKLNTTSNYEKLKRDVFKDFHYCIEDSKLSKHMSEGVRAAKRILIDNNFKELGIEEDSFAYEYLFEEI